MTPIWNEGTTRTRRVFLAVAASALAACADLTGGGPAITGLDAAQARWQASHVVDYQFDFQHSCFCAPIVTRPVTITVWHGQPLSVVYIDSGTTADTALFHQYLTMDRIFAFLRMELDGDPAVFAPVYDTSAGYPHQVYIDPVANAADEEVTIRVTALRLLPSPRASSQARPALGVEPVERLGAGGHAHGIAAAH